MVTIMSKDDWLKKLTGHGLPDEVVKAFLDNVKDEDLVRMKDLGDDKVIDIIKEAINSEVVDEETEVTETDKKPEGEPEAEESNDSEEAAQAVLIGVVKDTIAASLKEIAVEIPELAELSNIKTEIAALKEGFTQLTGMLKDVLEAYSNASKEETQKIKELIGNMSPAQHDRLRRSADPEAVVTRIVSRMKEVEQTIKKPVPPTSASLVPGGPPPSTEVVAMDTEGNIYANLGDMAFGRSPKKAK
jgi:ElaB/YqjD/DUF883 family membrane-anchored ribosome-binding protein